MSDLAKISLIPNFLDDERENFCRQIVARKGLVASYIESIDKDASPDIAKERAMFLLSSPEVCARLERLEKERLIYRNLTKESLVVGLQEMYEVSIADYYDENFQSLKPSREWTPAMKMAAKKIKQTRFGVELEIQGKEFLIEKITSVLGFDAPSVNIELKGEFAQYSDAELAKLAGVEDVEYKEVK